LDNYNAAEFWNNHLKEHNNNTDITYYLNDDVILSPDCLKNSINSMEKFFPDLDGLVCIVQEGFGNLKTVPTAFGALGRKFVERFPDKKVFCQDFKRFFLDEELYLYSKSINKCYYDVDSKLIHCHPVLDKKYEDSTHFEVRKYWKQDKIIFDERRKLNYLWGKDFNLIHEK
jgi:hypothetical protein